MEGEKMKQLTLGRAMRQLTAAGEEVGWDVPLLTTQGHHVTALPVEFFEGEGGAVFVVAFATPSPRKLTISKALTALEWAEGHFADDAPMFTAGGDRVIGLLALPHGLVVCDDTPQGRNLVRRRGLRVVAAE
jgi:hypothetical protein